MGRRIEIMDGESVINTIIASVSFAEEHYPGAWRLAAVQDGPQAPPVADACSPAQGLIALFDLRGITEADIVGMIDAVPDDAARYRARIAFTRASDWRRDHPVIIMLAQELGMSEADVDALFAHAATVEV